VFIDPGKAKSAGCGSEVKVSTSAYDFSPVINFNFDSCISGRFLASSGNAAVQKVNEPW